MARHSAAVERDNNRIGLLATIISSLFASEDSKITKPGEWFGDEKTVAMEDEEIIAVLSSAIAKKKRV